MVTTDSDLVARFVSGDPGAVGDLYRRYARPMYTLALRSLGDRGLAEEAVQQSFLQAWRAAGRFDPARDVAPWLFTITKRVAVDLYRRERRHRNHSVIDDRAADTPTDLETAWTAWEVRRALDEMPADERLIVEVTHFLGLTHEQAAARLGIPIGTVKSRSHRAHRRLAALLLHLQEASA
ncbi:MAG: RNA polymerase sigma factor [Acidimicrobiia bacterium]|nr:RNA polymerase sigma factor [Acidimicrobiia bacterium]